MSKILALAIFGLICSTSFARETRHEIDCERVQKFASFVQKAKRMGAGPEDVIEMFVGVNRHHKKQIPAIKGLLDDIFTLPKTLTIDEVGQIYLNKCNRGEVKLEKI